MSKALKFIALSAILTGMVASACAPQAAAPPVPSPVPGVGVTPAAPAPKPAPTTQQVKLQIPSRATILVPFFMGKEKGIYKMDGIDLEPILVAAGIAVPALLSGELDYMEGVTTAMVPSYLGAPLKALMSISRGGIWSIIVGPEVSKGSDLKGKSVATTGPGTMAYYATKKAIASLGLDPDKDVVYVNVPYDARYPALKSKSAAAAVLTPPADTVAVEEGYKSLVFTGDVLDLPGDGLVTTEKKLKDNPDEVRRMIRATLKSMAYVKDNPQEAISFQVKEFGLEEKLARFSYETVVKKIWVFDGSITPKGIQGVVDMALAGGQIRGTVDPQKAVDLTILKEVQKELKLAP